MSKENQLTIFHQDSDITFKMVKGGYFHDAESITIAIETERVGSDEFPNRALFCLNDYPAAGVPSIGDSFSGKTYDDPKRQNDNAGMTFAYFQFHADNVEPVWKIIDMDGDKIQFSLVDHHDDIDYYDEGAKPTPTHGKFWLSPRPKPELWNPERHEFCVPMFAK